MQAGFAQIGEGAAMYGLKSLVRSMTYDFSMQVGESIRVRMTAALNSTWFLDSFLF